MKALASIALAAVLTGYATPIEAEPAIPSHPIQLAWHGQWHGGWGWGGGRHDHGYPRAQMWSQSWGPHGHFRGNQYWERHSDHYYGDRYWYRSWSRSDRAWGRPRVVLPASNVIYQRTCLVNLNGEVVSGMVDNNGFCRVRWGDRVRLFDYFE